MAAIASSLSLHSQQATDLEEDTYELSPFTVQGDDADGYRAASTLAGSRLRTPLRDVGSAIQVITEEFFEDTGATDASTMLAYTLGTETGGTQGNFAGGGFDGAGRSDQDSARRSPESNQRVRGLDAATLTRSFFLTNIAFDSYNSSRVTINRGPNSILFGVGSPGGIIDNSLNLASLGKDFGKAEFRFGNNGTYRGTIDYNKVLIDDRLAIRFAGLNSENNYNQKPAYTSQERVYMAAEGVLFKNQDSVFLGETKIRVNSEIGNIESNPPMVVPPTITYDGWWDGATVDYAQYTGTNPPARHVAGTGFESQFLSNINDTANGLVNGGGNTPSLAPAFNQGILVFSDASSSNAPASPSQIYSNTAGLQARGETDQGRYETQWTQSPNGLGYATGFSPPVIQDRNVFDFEKLSFAGTTSIVEQDFTTYNATFEQTFFDDKQAGIEISFDRQDWERYARMPVSDVVQSVNSSANIGIELSELLLTGEPNPNVGRPVVRIRDFGGHLENLVDREAMRATAYYEFDFNDIGENWGKWIGKHRMSAFVGNQEVTSDIRREQMAWNSDTVNMRTQAWGGVDGNFWREVVGFAYVGPSALNASGPEDVRINPINVPVPEVGDTFDLWFQTRPGLAEYQQALRTGSFRAESVLWGGNKTKQEIDSKAFTIQSDFLGGHLVALLGWRNDESSSFERLTPDQLEALTGTSSRNTPGGALKLENFILQDDPVSVEEGDTFTGSLVAHVPDSYTEFLPFSPRISAHYGESENFSPGGVRRTVFGDVLSPPTGTTEEYGFSMEFSSKLSMRFNWFETSLKNGDAGLGAATASGRIAYSLLRNVADPLSVNMPWSDFKVELLREVDGPDPVPNINSYADMEAAIISTIPAEVQSLLNYRVVEENGIYSVQNNDLQGQVATTGIVAEGFEIDIVGNPLPNWRIMFNVSKQETVQSNSAQELKRLTDIVVSNLRSSGLWDLRSSALTGPPTFGDDYSRLVLVPLNGVLAKDGTTSLEQRKWRANLITNYRFLEDSPLRGFGAGGAIRWQDEAAIGFGQFVSPEAGIVPDLSKPFFAPAQMNGDLWVSYRKALNNKIDWKLQLNVNNAFGDDESIPVKANPDGQVAVIRIPNEKRWFLTSTFEF